MLPPSAGRAYQLGRCLAFAETKEQLGGYYLLECQNLDEAIEAASKMPSVDRGSVEIRPIQEFDQPEQPS